jgi:opacity protein-like surface antigen
VLQSRFFRSALAGTAFHFLSTAIAPSTSRGQTPAPPTGSTAVIALSPVVSADSHTDTGFGFSGGLDYFLSPSVSVGGLAGHWSAASDFQKDSTETYLGASVTYHWSSGQFSPFVQVGGGLYWLKFQYETRSRFAISEVETLGGFFVGAGLDRSVSRSTAVHLSARYHVVGDSGGVPSDFFEGLIGVRFDLSSP